jgi:DNA polymerase-3 subunit alpha
MQPKLWAEKAPEYVTEARQLGIHINPPSIQHSEIGFTISGERIFFGLEAIRDVGKTGAKYIVKARGQTPFASILDFLIRCNTSKVNTKVFTALIKAGAFDKMGYLRSELLEKTEELYNYVNTLTRQAERSQEIALRLLEDTSNNLLIEERDALREKLKNSTRKRNPGPQLDLQEESRLEELEAMKLRKRVPLKPIDMPEEPQLTRTKVVKISLSEILEQAEYIGCYLQQHPAQIIFPYASPISSVEDSEFHTVAGVVMRRKDITTKRGTPMAFIEISDKTGICELVVFSTAYAKLKLPNPGDIVQASGRAEVSETATKLRLDKIDIYRSPDEL